jgi:hypothetical protein
VSEIGHPFHITIAYNWYLMGQFYLQGMDRKNSGLEPGKYYTQAIDCFKRSATIYTILHGEDHSWTKQVQLRLHETEQLAKAHHSKTSAK